MKTQDIENIIKKHVIHDCIGTDELFNVDDAANEICARFIRELNAAFEGISFRQDLAHEGYHGFSSDTPNPKCKCCQLMFKLKKLGINIDENFIWETEV